MVKEKWSCSRYLSQRWEGCWPFSVVLCAQAWTPLSPASFLLAEPWTCAGIQLCWHCCFLAEDWHWPGWAEKVRKSVFSTKAHGKTGSATPWVLLPVILQALLPNEQLVHTWEQCVLNPGPQSWNSSVQMSPKGKATFLEEPHQVTYKSTVTEEDRFSPRPSSNTAIFIFLT